MEKIPLRSFGGQSAPEPVVRGWRTFTELPGEARQDIWSLLAPLMTAPGDEDTGRRVRAWCGKHDVPAERLHAATEALGALVRLASAADLGAEDFRADLEALCPGPPETESVESALAGYENARRRLRELALQSTLGDHGRMLTGLHWRVDELRSSDHAVGFRIPVATLTLQYREGGREDRISLQLSPEAVRTLKVVCEQLLS